jgi:ubiquitin conjugation factor E4 B
MALTGSLSADSEEAKQCASDSFLRLLEADPKVSKTLPKDYLNRLTIHATEIDSISDLFDPILAQLRLKLSNTSGVDLNFTSSPLTLDTVCRPLRALTLLAAQSSLAMRIVRIPQFLISSQMQSGRTLEFQTLLGPALSLTSTNLTALNKMLPLARKHERFITPEIESQTNVLRGTLSDLQLTFFRLLQNLLRVNSESRDTCLKLISSYLTCNNARSKMQFDRSAVSTNGFMVNLSAALLQLCRPLFENDKITTVDLSYLVPSAHSRISFSDFDRLSATPAEVKEIENGCIGSSSAQPHSFVTEIFFLTHHCLHVGFDSVVREFYSLNDQIARGFSTLKQHPDDVQLKEQLLAKVAELHCMRACVVNHDFLRPLGQFYESTCSLFMQRIESEDERQAALMRLIPEYIVDGMIKYFDLLKHFSADSIKSERWTALLSFVCECMQRRGSTSVSRTAVGELRVEGRGRTLVKNTHLRSKLLDILGLFLPPRDGSASAAFRLDHQHPFVVHPTLSSVLVPSLLKLYSDVEFTGRHAQFYEKFTPRQQINELLECAWQYASHRATFERISQEAKNADFEKFVHTIISDSIFLLDESLKYLSQIREVEQLQANRASWDALTAEQRSDKEAALQSAEGTCKFMMQLSNGMFRLLGFLAPALTHTFTSDMFAQPLADMLNYYIKTLVGPAVQDLRVREPEKYEFRPKELLRDILRIFIACCGSERFQSCVVRDERSYSAEILSRTVGLVFRTNLLPRTEVAALEVIAGTLAKLSESAVDEVGDEDVPDEFFDPLTAALMSDPVVLPSKNVCDRRTIKRHLLTQQTDPFTQLPMSEDDLIDDAKLRGKIEQWTASRNSKTSNKQ